MAQSRVEIVQNRLTEYLETAAPASRLLAETAPVSQDSSLTVRQAVTVFGDQVTARQIDVTARAMKLRDEGFYTISSAGHEQNAVLGAQLRTTDPCFLHYRSAAFMMARSRQDPDVDPVRDTLLSIAAAKADPISGGRHKVWGSKRLWVPPQTSTIASHVPKATGMAFWLARRHAMGLSAELPWDSIVYCSFGDASINHATALAGINSARYAFRRGNPTPILFVCEDNRVGISLAKPRRWITDSFAGLSQLEYILAQGEIDEIWATVKSAIDLCRTKRRPVFLRLPTVRLWGHAGTDVESTYRTLEEIEAVEAQDPLLQNARRLVETGSATPALLRGIVREAQENVEEIARAIGGSPRLTTLSEIAAPIAPWNDRRILQSAQGAPGDDARRKLHNGQLPEEAKAPSKRTMAAHINSALADEMLRRPEIVVFGEDVARKGGVYYVTAGLQQRFGHVRVFDTLLDETTILGLAQGAGQGGLLPIPEIQYLAYLHNAIDQLRGEASSLAFFSDGQYTNPMVVRIASFAYQKGFGGHFHNDNAIGALREIPGLLLAAPSRGDDAARMLRGLLAAAMECGRVVCFLEPIALYHEKDLYEEGDRGWLTNYPPPGEALLPGDVAVYGEDHKDLLIVSYANGLRMSLRAARRLHENDGIRARVLDLRWLNPLPLGAVAEHAADCNGVLVADECRATGAGIADAVIAHLAESGYREPLGSVRSADSFVPLGPAADIVLLSEDQIVEAARDLS